MHFYLFLDIRNWRFSRLDSQSVVGHDLQSNLHRDFDILEQKGRHPLVSYHIRGGGSMVPNILIFQFCHFNASKFLAEYFCNDLKSHCASFREKKKQKQNKKKKTDDHVVSALISKNINKHFWAAEKTVICP